MRADGQPLVKLSKTKGAVRTGPEIQRAIQNARGLHPPAHFVQL